MLSDLISIHPSSVASEGLVQLSASVTLDYVPAVAGDDNFNSLRNQILRSAPQGATHYVLRDIRHDPNDVGGAAVAWFYLQDFVNHHVDVCYYGSEDGSESRYA